MSNIPAPSRRGLLHFGPLPPVSRPAGSSLGRTERAAFHRGRFFLDNSATEHYQYINVHLCINEWRPPLPVEASERTLTNKKKGSELDLYKRLDTVAFLGKSISDANRLRILLSLTNGKKSVSGVVEELNLSQPLVSHHLKELRRSLVVTVERKGPFVYYEVADKKIIAIIRALADLAADLLADRDRF